MNQEILRYKATYAAKAYLQEKLEVKMNFRFLVYLVLIVIFPLVGIPGDCQLAKEVCNDAIDNDGDGIPDCGTPVHRHVQRMGQCAIQAFGSGGAARRADCGGGPILSPALPRIRGGQTLPASADERLPGGPFGWPD